MKNLELNGLQEMTRQEMMEVDGGFAWIVFGAALAAGLLYAAVAY
ncbi:MAG: class IIb bacteriocin, lactobin A/cerein 7B family [Candidatus Azobacteroides sp.]|nr:class IIb bacteriocin, lactobin A/cerein 7B family [Candidatus Azobacteroides sp.]